MPRQAARPRVARINLDVIRRAYRELPGKGESDFYILEKANGPCLRVRRTTVQIGVRSVGRFHISADLHPDMTLEQVEGARAEARRLLHLLEDEQSLPGLARGRSMTLLKLYEEFMADFKETRGASRSPRTLESYEASGGSISCPSWVTSGSPRSRPTSSAASSVRFRTE